MTKLAYPTRGTLLVDGVSSSEVYVGEASSKSSTADPVWSIFKVVVSGTLVSIKFADGNADYDNVWDDRASLTYL